MDKRAEELTRRPIYVYDLPRDLLTTLQVRDRSSTEPDHEDEIISTRSNSISTTTGDTIVHGTKACSLCGVSFNTVEEQRSHIRSDFHGYNLKQKLRNLPPVSENDFERLVGDLNESLSGSDSESEDEEEGSGRKNNTLVALLKSQAKLTEKSSDDPATKRPRGPGKPPLYWFSSSIFPSNTYLGVYRAIFSNTEQEDEASIIETVNRKQLSPKPIPKLPKDSENGTPIPATYAGPHIFMCMIGGGHFAAMIVALTPKLTKSSTPGPLSREATVLAHKTFHRYTTRRKQGGSQSANDSAKGAAHSAGAGIRRYNEVALTDEVRLLLHDWKGMIDTSELLFVRATGTSNRKTLFGPYDEQVLRQNDPRVRGFPFNTRRATQNELMRSFIELTRVKIREVDEAAIAAAAVAAESARQAAIDKANSKPAPVVEKRSEAEETAILHTSQMQTLIRRSKLPALLTYLKSNSLTPDFAFYPQDTLQNHHAPTPLSLAASLNSPPMVLGLLVKAGANPILKNGDGKPAFDLAGDRQTRDAFRVARSTLGEDSFDWEAANVPAALSAEEASEREVVAKKEEKSKEEERRKAEAERLKAEGPKVAADAVLGKAAGRGRALALGHVQKTAQERREEESKGLTPEMKMRLERERRARAAEERMKKAAAGPS